MKDEITLFCDKTPLEPPHSPYEVYYLEYLKQLVFARAKRESSPSSFTRNTEIFIWPYNREAFMRESLAAISTEWGRGKLRYYTPFGIETNRGIIYAPRRMVVEYSLGEDLRRYFVNLPYYRRYLGKTEFFMGEGLKTEESLAVNTVLHENLDSTSNREFSQLFMQKVQSLANLREAIRTDTQIAGCEEVNLEAIRSTEVNPFVAERLASRMTALFEDRWRIGSACAQQIQSEMLWEMGYTGEPWTWDRIREEGNLVLDITSLYENALGLADKVVAEGQS